MRPDFIIGGTVAAGTSYLSSVLLAHPEVYLAQPMRPECNFFIKSAEYAKGLPYYESRWFAGAAGRPAVGERSSLYLSDFRDGVVAERIRAAVPGVKLIFMLRDPVARAYANWRFTCLSGLEGLPFERALDREDARIAAARGGWADIQPYAYVRRGWYARQLKPYYDRFPRERILVLNSDLVRRDPPGEVRRVLRFLGVSEAFALPPASEFTSPAVRGLALQRALRWLDPLALDEAVERSRTGEARGWRDRLVRWNLVTPPPPMHPATRTRLRELYAPSYAELAPYVDWTMDVWRS
jgi:hypothetical protein